MTLFILTTQHCVNVPWGHVIYWKPLNIVNIATFFYTSAFRVMWCLLWEVGDHVIQVCVCVCVCGFFNQAFVPCSPALKCRLFTLPVLCYLLHPWWCSVFLLFGPSQNRCTSPMEVSVWTVSTWHMWDFSPWRYTQVSRSLADWQMFLYKLLNILLIDYIWHFFRQVHRNIPWLCFL